MHSLWVSYWEPNNEETLPEITLHLGVQISHYVRTIDQAMRSQTFGILEEDKPGNGQGYQIRCVSERCVMLPLWPASAATWDANFISQLSASKVSLFQRSPIRSSILQTPTLQHG